MRVTKEKLLAAASLVLAALVGLPPLVALSGRSLEEVPVVPAAEAPRAYRTVSAAARLAPERTLAPGARDPFQPEDPWAESEPAPIPLPPAPTWPRALPGGLVDAPRAPADRLALPGSEVTR